MLLESACAFILIAGSRTLNTWNSCMCHLCIIAPLCISLFLTFKLHKLHLHPCVLPWLLPHWTQEFGSLLIKLHQCIDIFIKFWLIKHLNEQTHLITRSPTWWETQKLTLPGL
jgi:hypothetical protein